MGMTPRYYLADMHSGDLYATALPLEDVMLRSSLQPGQFSATLDLRKYGARQGRSRATEMRDGRQLINLLRDGKCTLVAVLEGESSGPSSAPETVALGEWWVSKASGSRNSPIVSLSGPELPGYAAHRLVERPRNGEQIDPVAAARFMLGELFEGFQINLGSWTAQDRTKVAVDAWSTDYWAAIADVQENEEAPFEWTIRTGLTLNGWSPVRVTRTLDVGQPVLSTPRHGVALSLTSPGDPTATITDASWGFDEARSATTIYGWGSGSGDDQIRGSYSRDLYPGEPVKSRQISVPHVGWVNGVRREARAALRRMTPGDDIYTAVMPTGTYMPRVGEEYTWRQYPSWTHIERNPLVRCVAWEWRSGQAIDAFTLSLTESYTPPPGPTT